MIPLTKAQNRLKSGFHIKRLNYSTAVGSDKRNFQITQKKTYQNANVYTATVRTVSWHKLSNPDAWTH